MTPEPVDQFERKILEMQEGDTGKLDGNLLSQESFTINLGGDSFCSKVD